MTPFAHWTTASLALASLFSTAWSLPTPVPKQDRVEGGVESKSIVAAKTLSGSPALNNESELSPEKQFAARFAEILASSRGLENTITHQRDERKAFVTKNTEKPTFASPLSIQEQLLRELGRTKFRRLVDEAVALKEVERLHFEAQRAHLIAFLNGERGTELIDLLYGGLDDTKTRRLEETAAVDHDEAKALEKKRIVPFDRAPFEARRARITAMLNSDRGPALVNALYGGLVAGQAAQPNEGREFAKAAPLSIQEEFEARRGEFLAVLYGGLLRTETRRLVDEAMALKEVERDRFEAQRAHLIAFLNTEQGIEFVDSLYGGLDGKKARQLDETAAAGHEEAEPLEKRHRAQLEFYRSRIVAALNSDRGPALVNSFYGARPLDWTDGPGLDTTDGRFDWTNGGFD